MAEKTKKVVTSAKQALLATLLLERGIHVSADDFQNMIIMAVDSIRKVRPIDPRKGLTPREVEELEEGGFELDETVRDGQDPLADAASEFSAMLASSVSVAEAAVHLGVKGSRVRQRLGHRSLYGIKVGREWRLPVFQFEDGAEIPGLAHVLKVIDRKVHSLTLRRWLVSPNPDLQVDDSPVAPLVWLKSGRDPKTLAKLGANL